MHIRLLCIKFFLSHVYFHKLFCNFVFFHGAGLFPSGQWKSAVIFDFNNMASFAPCGNSAISIAKNFGLCPHKWHRFLQNGRLQIFSAHDFLLLLFRCNLPLMSAPSLIKITVPELSGCTICFYIGFLKSLQYFSFGSSFFIRLYGNHCISGCTAFKNSPALWRSFP